MSHGTLNFTIVTFPLYVLNKEEQLFLGIVTSVFNDRRKKTTNYDIRNEIRSILMSSADWGKGGGGHSTLVFQAVLC